MTTFKSLERFGKCIIRGIIRFLPGSGRIRPEDVDISSIFRILVIRQDARLGNLVLMSPLLGALREAFPDAELDVLISEGFESILAGNPNVTRVLVFEKQIRLKMLWKYLGVVDDLRIARIDLAVDVSTATFFPERSVLTRLSGARYRIVYDRGDAGHI